MVVEQKLPNCLENRISLRMATLASLQTLVKVIEDNKWADDVQVVLLTAAGVIMGNIEATVKEPEITKTERKYQLDISYLEQMFNNYIGEFEKDHAEIQIADSGAFISLKNATLSSVSNPLARSSFNQLLVFVDQIIGFSLINRRTYESQLAQRRS